MNQVMLTGRIATNLNLKYVKGGNPMVRFNIAVKQEYKTNGRVEADFFTVIAFRRTAENLVQYKDTGDYIEVVGKLNRHDYYDKETNEHRVLISVQADKINYPNVGERRNKEDDDVQNKDFKEIDDIVIDDEDLPF